MKRILFPLALLVLFTVSLVGCSPLPTCAPGDLVQANLTTPPMWGTVTSLTPTLSWSYPDTTCAPEYYRVALRTGPFFIDELGGTTSGPATNWTPSTPLEPGTEYSWGVQAMVGSTSGYFAGSNYFFTGPMCPTEDLVAPDLLEPANAAVVNEDWPTLIWDYPEACLPEGYRIDLSTDPTFADTSLSGGTGNPSTRWAAGHPLDDCQLYYWKVAPINGTTLGPESTVRSFFIDVAGTCSGWITPSITGTVYHDLCGVPELGPLPDPLPIGCVSTGGGGVAANGLFGLGEPGIPNVVVRLGQGTCPSATDLGAVLTDANGMFAFLDLAPGDYCVTVNALTDDNDLQLIPGGWTAPAGGISGELASWTVNFAGGEPVTAVNFGWDFQFLPTWGEYAPITGMVWHDLCPVVPGTTPPSPLPDGCVADGGLVHADGIRQPTEPGLPGVVVDLGYGACPSAGLAEAVTDAEGLFTFHVPSPGDYCLRVDAEGSTNAAILLPGHWTMVASGHMGMTHRAISVSNSSGLANQDFGWDYDNLPLSFSPAIFHLLMNAHCRMGPRTDYPIVTSFMAGDSFEAGGVSQDRAWIYHAPYRCFVALSTGEFQGAADDLGAILDDLNVIPTPLLPATDTPQFSCSSYTDSQSCTAHYPYCEWYLPDQGRGYCRNR
ncbi:MAG: hypothetical protein JXB85_14460 [Anaerolineales bacterium]|nr:hypothetical protein [Anaerolineales bacterium]